MSSRAALAAWLLLTCCGTFAAAFPDKPIRIVTADAGGGSDVIARLIGVGLTASWGQQIVVDNRGGGTIAGEIVSRAPADGYTLLYYGGTLWILPLMRKSVPYDTLRDFAPVSLSVKGANVLLVHPSLPAKNLKELLTLARAQPGRLNYASSGIGSANHMAGELLKLVARVNIAHVPYKGNAPALTDLIGGHVEVLISGVPAVLGQIRNGRVRAIAIASLKRFPALPDTPTIDESGLKGFEATTWFGVMAPAKTPREIVNRLNADLARIVATPEVRERFIGEGVEPVGGSTELFAAFVRDEIDKYGKVVRAASLTAD